MNHLATILSHSNRQIAVSACILPQIKSLKSYGECVFTDRKQMTNLRKACLRNFDSSDSVNHVTSRSFYKYIPSKFRTSLFHKVEPDHIAAILRCVHQMSTHFAFSYQKGALPGSAGHLETTHCLLPNSTQHSFFQRVKLFQTCALRTDIFLLKITISQEKCINSKNVKT